MYEHTKYLQGSLSVFTNSTFWLATVFKSKVVTFKYKANDLRKEGSITFIVKWS